MNTWIAMCRLVCLVSVLLGMTACLNLQKSYPEKRLFALDASSEGQEPGPETTMVLKISKFRVSPLFGGRAMVSRLGEFQYENDFYDEWFISPSAMLTQQFHDWLTKTGRIRFVLLGANHLEPTHVLEGSVTEFYGDYRLGGAPKAIFGIGILLLDEVNNRRVLFRRTYHEEVPLTDRTPDALAGGLSQAVRFVLVDLDRELAAMMRAAPAPSPR